VSGDAPDVVVDVDSLTVRLRRVHHGVRSLREYAVHWLSTRRSRDVEMLTVLEEVSLRVLRGQLVAVLGPNGAGKTTLVRVLAGIVPPSAGRVAVQGSIAPLIELGGGFDPELTGVENVRLFSALLGRRFHRLREDVAAIVDFAGIGEAIDVAVKTYSAGMIARLAFATATAAAPDVLLVDEVLAVGDEVFRSRCVERIASLRAHGSSVVLVTHDLDLVEREADAAFYLDRGRVAAAGTPGDVVAAYRRSLTG
jgi:ABC-type polysaccharide/polyol phosphate transport system ATPase subunit